MMWVDFKKHLTREWKQIGFPSGGKSTEKALNVSTPGSAYFPFKCNWCDKVGHKAQNCPDRLASKPKAKKNGRGGGGGKFNAKSSNQGQFSSGNKQKKDLSHIKCYNCGKMGHYKNKCPKEK
jgi:Zinc knuckle